MAQSSPNSVVASPGTIRSVVLAGACFLLVMLIALLLVAARGQFAFGAAGLQAAVVSWVVVAAGAGLALVISMVSCRSSQASVANLAAMLPRLAVPLIGLVGLGKLLPEWASNGGPAALLMSYFAALAVETWVMVRFLCPLAPVATNKATISSGKPLGA